MEEPGCSGHLAAPEGTSHSGITRWRLDAMPYCAAQMPFLGTRKRDDKGKLGPYTWMTYAQVGRSPAALPSSRPVWPESATF